MLAPARAPPLRTGSPPTTGRPIWMRARTQVTLCLPANALACIATRSQTRGLRVGLARLSGADRIGHKIQCIVCPSIEEARRREAFRSLVPQAAAASFARTLLGAPEPLISRGCRARKSNTPREAKAPNGFCWRPSLNGNSSDTESSSISCARGSAAAARRRPKQLKRRRRLCLCSPRFSSPLSTTFPIRRASLGTGDEPRIRAYCCCPSGLAAPPAGSQKWWRRHTHRVSECSCFETLLLLLFRRAQRSQPPPLLLLPVLGLVCCPVRWLARNKGTAGQEGASTAAAGERSCARSARTAGEASAALACCAPRAGRLAICQRVCVSVTLACWPRLASPSSARNDDAKFRPNSVGFGKKVCCFSSA